MTQIKNRNYSAEIQMTAIELLESSLTLPSNSDLSITDYDFNVSIESKVDSDLKLIFIIVSIEIRNDDQSLILGSVRVSCIFNIVNFEEMITPNSKGILQINTSLAEMLNSASISTTRGVMFGIFKGTFLHNATLPIVNPNIISAKLTKKY